VSLGSYTSAAFTTAAGVAVAATADVEVRRESDGALASIFSDRAGSSAISQPGFQADSEGRFIFFAAGIADGYQVKVTKGAETHTARYQATGTARELDADPFWATVLAAATRLAARLTLRALGFDGVTTRATNTILAAADAGEAFVATGSFTQTLTEAATLADGWHVHYRVNSGQTVTIDPDGAELIDGAATKVVVGPAAGIIVCDGAALHTFGFDQPNASTTVRGIVELATQAEMDAGTADKVPTTDLNKIALGTPQATTSGTAFDFTVPAGARRIKILPRGMSLSGTDNILVQIGTSGTPATTGYISTSTSSDQSGGTAGVSSTAGFIIHAAGAAFSISGGMTLNLVDASTNAWVAEHTIKKGTVDVTSGAGDVALAGQVDIVRITRTGTNTFDAGSVNVAAER